MPDFRPRPVSMSTVRQLGRPAHDISASAALSVSVKAASDVSAVLEVTDGINGDLSEQLEVLRQRLDDADIP